MSDTTEYAVISLTRRTVPECHREIDSVISSAGASRTVGWDTDYVAPDFETVRIRIRGPEADVRRVMDAGSRARLW